MKPRWFFAMSIQINLVLLGLTFASFIMRMWRLAEPREVVFDEFHFGKFINMYLKQVFFFDIHPPLGKLLLAGAGYMADTNVSFPFERIGDEYPCDLPIWHLRFIPAFCGSLLVPIVYWIMIEIGYTHWAAVQAAVLVLFDNALITESRFILLDMMLLFFTFTSLILLFRLRKMKHRLVVNRYGQKKLAEFLLLRNCIPANDIRLPVQSMDREVNNVKLNEAIAMAVGRGKFFEEYVFLAQHSSQSHCPSHLFRHCFIERSGLCEGPNDKLCWMGHPR